MSTTEHLSPRVANAHTEEAALREVNRKLWTLRIVGAAMLAVGWCAATFLDVGSARFILMTAVFAALGVYAFTAAAQSRRIAVNLERKLRHGLLVHNMELANMAMQDELTQLFNRRYFFDRLERELQTARGFDRPLAVLLLAVKGIRQVNAGHGYHVGDRLLGSFGRFLLQQTRASDVAARLGGDQFAILLPDTSQEAAEVFMTRLAQKLEETALLQEGNVALGLTVSCGLGGFPWDGNNVDDIVRRAEESTLASKRQARNATGAEATDGVAVASAPDNG